ncbi:MAG: cytochrome C oxidase subunit II [Bacteroidetes bacterium]|nr:cytochrome C oxidase subunit II [Bacteroidota bacterium]
MIDTTTVLAGQTIAYTLYVIVILLLMGWFGYQITRKGKSEGIKPALFYSFVGFLVVLGVSLHIVTHETIPWKPIDLNRDKIAHDKLFEISIKDHQYKLPADTLKIDQNDMVLFKVTSEDLTYGFGLFRQDNSMLFQMQVIPGHMNDILWKFDKPQVYTIRSTEYSGWKGSNMILKDVVVVK